MQIFVDDREQRSELAAAIRRATGIEPVVRRLGAGDIQLGNEGLIERKGARDFIESILEGRMARQLAALSSEPFKTKVLIIEGAFDGETLAGFSADQLRGAMLSAWMDWGVVVLRSRDVENTAQWVGALMWRIKGQSEPLGLEYEPVQGGGSAAGARRASPARSSEALQLAALERVPGLGREKARLLLARFGSIHGVRGASVQALSEVEGIGPKLARRIQTALHEAKY